MMTDDDAVTLQAETMFALVKRGRSSELGALWDKWVAPKLPDYSEPLRERLRELYARNYQRVT